MLDRETPAVPGTAGYAREAEALIARYESVAFEDKHRAVLDQVPDAPSRVLDVGAGTGADAAWLANWGHRVIAVEPTRELRHAGARLHPSPRIEWIDDSLPDLALLHGTAFDLILISAVWMHLDAAERPRAMDTVASLLAPGGIVLLSLRHGPPPPFRRMFDVSAEETISLARARGLQTVVQARAESAQAANRAAGIEWSHLAFLYS